jgi:hypothetical protein
VRTAIQAMNSRNKEQWFDLFSPNAQLTDDGDPHDLKKWSDEELFGSSVSYLASIDKIEDDGLTIYGKMHSGRWGECKTFLKFRVENGKVTRLAVGQTDY